MKKRKKLAAGAALAVGTALAPEIAHAAVITVTTTADNNPDGPLAKSVQTQALVTDGACSLREAIINANDDAATWPDCDAGSGLDTIQFNLPNPSTILVDGASFEITDSLIIDGPGDEDDLIIDAQDTSRVFTINDFDSGTLIDVTIQDLTLTNGDTSLESFADGGAIYSEEDLTVTSVTITNSDAPGDGSGGAIRVLGSGIPPSLTVQTSLLTGNTAACCGGAIGVLYADTVSITNTEISGANTAQYGGGVAILYTTTVALDEANITGNMAIGPGGGLYIYGVSDSVTIENSVISGNEAGANGAGIQMSSGPGTLTIRDTTVSENQAGTTGAGLYLYDIGEVTMERVRVIGNDATLYDGGLALFGVTVTISESEISGNTAPTTGGLYAGYGTFLYLRNNTVAYNTATTGDAGGISVINSYADIQVSTISHNSAPAGTAGNMSLYGSFLYMDNSIIANGTALVSPDLVTSNSTATINYSIIEDPTGATFGGANNKTGPLNDPQLGSLQNNGGTTQTMKPANTSPAVNAGDPSFTTPTIDQRGFTRPIGVVDIGAVELNPGTLAISAPESVTEDAGFVTITVNRTGGSDGAASVNYATSSGTATSGADFTATSGMLNWADGDAAPKSFNVPITDDLIFEGSEQFTVTLAGATGAALGADTANIIITDNDGPPTISINNTGATEGANVVFDVTLSNPTTQTVTVDFGTGGGTATSGTDFTANSGTVIFNPLDTSEQVTVATTQDSIDEPAETFTVTLSNPNANATIFDGTGDGTITDDDPTPTISINNASQTEGGNVVFDVTLSAPSAQTITVEFATAGVDATSGVDFTPNSGTVTFNPLDTSEPITVATIQDAIDEPNETFNVVLTNPTNATTAVDTGVGTITDDDGAPALNVTDVSQAEGNAGNTIFVFTVTLAPASGQTVTVDYTTQDVTANAGSDYTTTSGTLTFAAGDTSETIPVPVTGDTNVEPNETFNVVLSNAPLATFSDNTAVGTITNDDVLPSLMINDVTLDEGNGDTTNFVFTVTLTPSSSQTVTVNYTTQAGTAAAGSDYTTTAGTLTFIPGDTSETITVPVSGDTSIEGDETFTVVLSGASLAAITDDSGTGTITNDDVAPVADLSVTKTVVGSGPFIVGQNATFTITLSNSGPDAAANATVTDILPAGTTFVSATPSSGTCNGTMTVICNVGTLANGANATITLTVQLNAPGLITNTATGASDAGDVSPAFGSAAITVSAAANGADIPTVSHWMLIALASALAAAAVLRVKP